MGLELQPGQFATGREAASSDLGISGSAWYRGMQRLQELGSITIKANNRFTIVSIVKWESYQGDVNNEWTTDEQRLNNKRTTDEQQADTIEEGKEIKERKNTSSSANLDFQFSCTGEPASFTITSGDLQMWCHAYPDIDVRAEILRAKSALVTTNDIRSMTATRRYLNSWLQNASSKKESGKPSKTSKNQEDLLPGSMFA